MAGIAVILILKASGMKLPAMTVAGAQSAPMPFKEIMFPTVQQSYFPDYDIGFSWGNNAIKQASKEVETNNWALYSSPVPSGFFNP